MSFRIKTGISQAFWCKPEQDGNKPFRIEPARQVLPSGGVHDEPIAWFDRLFEGGIEIPDPPAPNEARALFMLVAGPAGCGKTTLALELCQRCTVPSAFGKTGAKSLYISSESPASWLIQNANSFGWKDADARFGNRPDNKRHLPPVTIWETSDFQKFLTPQVEQAGFPARIIRAVAGILSDDLGKVFDAGYEKLQIYNAKAGVEEHEPDILVIDSLNTAQTQDRPQLFEKMLALANCGPKLLMIILDSGRSDNQYWEYIADIVIRLDRDYRADYMIRTLEIAKARFQSHTWGKHQLKLYPKPKQVTDTEARRAHPYREEGGLFIFPSIHYYLSEYKRRAPHSQPQASPTGLDGLDELLNGGFPSGRCTGFIGSRGGHKSHLGYKHLLSGILQGRPGTRHKSEKHRRGLIISLRDDEGMARKTLGKIVHTEFDEEPGLIDQLEREDRLEILYYPPGYITPEEFFHRMYLSIQRLKTYKNSEVTLLFNSLDQLSSRFPLCAKEQIFIPGIIETLNAESITSLFIAVEEPGQPPEQYGLLSMADLILSFGRRQFPRKDYCGHILSTRTTAKLDHDSIEALLPEFVQAVALRVVRFGGGSAAGAGGILELIDKKSDLFEKKGLHFVPFSPGYREGWEADHTFRPPSRAEDLVDLRHYFDAQANRSATDRTASDGDGSPKPAVTVHARNAPKRRRNAAR